MLASGSLVRSTRLTTYTRSAIQAVVRHGNGYAGLWLRSTLTFPNPACALQGIAARWFSAHYKDMARVIARAMARGLGFVTPCPNKQGENAYFSKVSDASGTASDVVNVRKDCKHFWPPVWVVFVEERGPFGGPNS